MYTNICNGARSSLLKPVSCMCLPGVTVLALGMEQADTEELRRVVTDGSIQNILYARDAAQLDTLHTDLADMLCGLARIPEV